MKGGAFCIAGAPPERPMTAPAAVATSSTASDFLQLTKPRLSSLVLVTAAGGMWLAPGALPGWKALAFMLGITGTVAAANTFNCWYERESDRLMKRTRNRPLPAGRMEPQIALLFGAALTAVSLPLLFLAVNLTTGLLGVLALVSYACVYTPMKAKSELAVVVGAVPGALPPLMGWSAVTGGMEQGGLVLFTIMFLWQIPHFIAIGMFRKQEYAAAGLKFVPQDRPDGIARGQILAYLVVLVPVTLMPFMVKVAGPIYLMLAAPLGLAFLGFGAWGFFKRLGEKWAKALFAFSIVYLFLLFVALVVDGGVGS